MRKHLLVTMGDDPRAFNKLRFVHRLFGCGQDLGLTLFYVSPSRPGHPGQAAAGDLGGPAPECDIRRGEEVLERARSWLTAMGMDCGDISTKVACSFKGTSEDIITEAENGLYDCVVVGRRGLTWIEELVAGSVSTGILKESIGFPVWICAREEYGRGGVLVCVDGSRQSLRMADHVGFILAGESGPPVRVLHVARGGSGLGDVAEAAAGIIRENGVPENRLEVEVVEAHDVDGAIIRRARDGDCAAVAVGMAGGRGQGLGKGFSHRLGLKLCDRLKTVSVWISK